MSQEPTTSTTEFIEAVTTTTMVPTIQQAIVTTTIRPIVIATMVLGPHSNIIPDGYFYGSSPVKY